jgi:hypothetical protein
MRLGIYPYGPSDSVAVLKNSLNEQFDENPARVLLRNGRSNFRGSRLDVIINWGSRSDNLSTLVQSARLLNTVSAVNTAALKDKTYLALYEAGVRQLDTTSSRTVAEAWVAEGEGVFARTVVNGHSGEGIVYVALDQPENLGPVDFSHQIPQAPLYTKAVNSPFKEYRVHVFKGEVIAIQQKRRQNGWRELDTYSHIVRNHGNGWVYATSGIEPSNDMLLQSLDAVKACGLDFGAVDILMKSEKAYVVEVNTAPGLGSPTTLDAYTKAIVEYSLGDNITPSVVAVPETDFTPTADISRELSDIQAVLETASFETVAQVAARQIAQGGQGAAGLRGAPFVEAMQSTSSHIHGVSPSLSFHDEAEYILTQAQVEGVLFREVATVIGEVNAYIQLAHAKRSYAESRTISWEHGLNNGFTWRATPQGHTFWESICDGETPEMPLATGILIPHFINEAIPNGTPQDIMSFSDEPYFQSIVDVIGREYALDELYKAHLAGVNFTPESNDVDMLFVWSTTPQGVLFWGSIMDGEVPEEYAGAAIVDSAPREPSTLSTPVFTSSMFFSTVSNAIGEGEAIRQLRLVHDSNPDCFDNSTSSLYGAFVWSNSPQGQSYWDAIYDGRNPEDVVVPTQTVTVDAPLSEVVPGVVVDLSSYVLGSFYKLTPTSGSLTMGKYEGNGLFSIIGFDMFVVANNFSLIEAA